ENVGAFSPTLMTVLYLPAQAGMAIAKTATRLRRTLRIDAFSCFNPLPPRSGRISMTCRAPPTAHSGHRPPTSTPASSPQGSIRRSDSEESTVPESVPRGRARRDGMLFGRVGRAGRSPAQPTEGTIGPLVGRAESVLRSTPPAMPRPCGGTALLVDPR